MVFVWRGFGLIVPIFFFICAWIVSLFYDDTRLGNASFMGWSCFYASMALLLPGLGLWGGTEEEDGTRKKHDFFFLPVAIWAVGLGILSAVVLFSRDDVPEENVVAGKADSVKEEVLLSRTLNILNSSDDTLYCSISNEKGMAKSIMVEPHIWEERTLDEGSYLFYCMDRNDEIVFRLPNEEIVKQSGKCVSVKGKDGMYSQRIFGPPTESKSDYDDVWLVLDGSRDIMQIDVTELCTGTRTSAEVKKMDWKANLDTVYDGSDLIEPDLWPYKNGGKVTVLEPGDDLPKTIARGERVWLLISVPKDKEITSEYIGGRLAGAYYEE
ncbi:MAG TPA: hypothetical protein VK826_14045 [Bacteroidia bacterium]|nr:hypothetical protein [Bacteroidia bacterium]